MTSGEKIRKFRIARELSQKQLAIMSRMSEPAIRNYELGNRQPSGEQLEKIALALGVSPYVLSNPNLDTYDGLMHTLFACEDLFDLKIDNVEGVFCLTPDKDKKSFHSMLDKFIVWHREAEKLRKGEITKEEYDAWRYTYPKMEAERFKEAIDVTRAKKQEAEHNGDV